MVPQGHRGDRPGGERVKAFAVGDLAAPKKDPGKVKRVTEVSGHGMFIKIEGNKEWLMADEYQQALIA